MKSHSRRRGRGLKGGPDASGEPEEPSFGAARGQPPSFYSRVPTAAVWELGSNKGITYKDLKVLLVLCAYANNQGICFPGQKRIAEVLGSERASVSKSIGKWVRLGHVSVISRYRSAWKGIYGNVYRVIYDQRLTDEDVIEAMEKVPARERDDEPLREEADTDNQAGDDKVDELVEKAVMTREALRLAHWFTARVAEENGQLRLVTDRSVSAALALLDSGLSPAEIEADAVTGIRKLVSAGRDAPHHLGFLPLSKG